MSRNTPWRTTRREYALHQPSINNWYRIKNVAGGPTQLHIYDEIGFFGVSASDLIRDMADVTGDLEVHINSPGGEVWDGIAIYNTLLARKNVTVHVDGIAASIASVIAMAGNPVLIARNAQIMIHEGFAMAVGNAQDMRDLAEQLDKASHNIASIYSDHTGKPIAYWREVMKAETWFDADESIEEGLADRMIDSGAGRRMKSPDDKWDMSVYHASGRQTLPPPTPDPEQFDYLDKILNWDAAAALAKCSSASDFRSICAGEHTSGEPDTAAHWALPHHASPGAGPDKGGVIAALGRWNQTQDLKNKDAALAHLKAHASSLGLPSGDGDGKSDGASNALELSDDDLARFAASLRL
jgi:ATP-dependent protease ClpP protease subunit